MENKEKIPEYGDPRYIFTLAWHDEAKKDYLIIKDYKLKDEVMNARAKGTTIYELIDIYGGVDNVTEAFSAKDAVYGDTTAIPEMANDESYNLMLQQLQAKLDELKAQQPTQNESVEKGGAEEK